MLFFLISDLGKKGMAYKRLSRKDYQNLIGIANEKRNPGQKRGEKLIKEVASPFRICCSPK